MRIGIKTIILIVLAAIGAGAALNYSKIRDYAMFRTPVCVDGLDCLDQGWSDVNRNWWYTTSQGSRLLPLDWFLALEQPSGTEADPRLFASTENLTRLGYLASPVSLSNPKGLPVGFTVDTDATPEANLMCSRFPKTCEGGTMQKSWVGMNCSACHTNEIALGKKRIRIEGAPTLADFQTFELEMLASLEETNKSDDKFARFAGKVLGKTADNAARESLKAQLGEQIAWYGALKDINKSDVAYGYGRLDAQGHILNKVVLAAGQAGKVETVRADAPASYPHIWNTSQQKRIQWNGIATNKFRPGIFGNNTDFGALIRNTTEVIGVFAHLEVEKGEAKKGYKSSARVLNLIGLERQLAEMQSPRWPAAFPALDPEKVKRGRKLFDEKRDFAGGKAACGDCHSHLEPDDVKGDMKENMTPIADIRTDIFLACNTYLHETATGNFENQKVFGFAGDPIKAKDATRLILINSTVGTMRAKIPDIAESFFDKVAPTGVGDKVKDFDVEAYLPGVTNIAKKADALSCLNATLKDGEDNILAYKARALNGIWATAPYLHNGSVPTLYDLLSTSDLKLKSEDTLRPASEPRRPAVFGVGSRQYDTAKGGFISDPNDPGTQFVFRTQDENGVPIPGNYNSGHDYGTSALSEEERMDLVEYLKSL